MQGGSLFSLGVDAPEAMIRAVVVHFAEDMVVVKPRTMSIQYGSKQCRCDGTTDTTLCV